MRALSVLTIFCLFSLYLSKDIYSFLQQKVMPQPPKNSYLRRKELRIHNSSEEKILEEYFELTKEENQEFEEVILSLMDLAAGYFQAQDQINVQSSSIENKIENFIYDIALSFQDLKNLKDLYFSDDSVADIGEFFHGFLEQANVTDSHTITDCYNNNTAKLTLQLLGAAISTIANDQFTDIPMIIAQYNKLIPSSVNACLRKNDDLIQVYKIYGITSKKLIEIFAEISKYSLEDIKAFHQKAVDENSKFQNQQYEQVGKDIGQLLLDIFNPKPPKLFKS